MGVLDLNMDDDRRGKADGRNRRRDHDDRAPAMVWVNVGFTTVDPETDEETFIGLPMGIPVDNMRPSRGKGWLAQRKNALQRQIMAMASKMEPDEEGVVGNLRVQLRRVAAEDPAAQIEAMQDMPKLELIR